MSGCDSNPNWKDAPCEVLAPIRIVSSASKAVTVPSVLCPGRSRAAAPWRRKARGLNRDDRH